MRRRTFSFGTLLAGAVLLGLAGSEVHAQAAGVTPELVIRSEHPDVPDQHARNVSPFELRGIADIAFTGIRNRGSQIVLLANDGTINYTQGFPVGLFLQGTQVGGSISPYFVADFVMAAAQGDWERARQDIPSLNNVTGGGWNAAWNVNAFFFAPFRQWMPGDDQLGRVHSGEQSTTDGSCKQHNLLSENNPLMAINDCPDTWGSEQFAGAKKKTTLPQWQELFEATADPSTFNWDWWRVDSAYISDELMGDAQTYYSFQDWADDRLRNSFGDVVPSSACLGCGEGDPTENGYPMGITVRADVFSYTLPAVADAAIWQMLLINNSEQLYGTGIDYDSLYVGNLHGVLFGGSGQNAAHYWVPELGALLLHKNGVNPGCNGAVTAGIGTCRYPQGLERGGTAIVFLKTPLGDLRNKLYSDPESPFFAPGHPDAGDTITFNHGHRCSFGACFGPVWQRSERAEFGLIASVEDHVFDGRTESSFESQAGWWDVFANIDYPTRTARFTEYAPPEGWDYNDDGMPDTLHVNSCDNARGCVEILSDTLPGGQNNTNGNFQGVTSAGPFALAAGDTAGYTIAFVGGRTPDEMVQNVRSVVAFYMNAYLGPQAPPAPNVVAVTTQPGDRDPGDTQPPPARVTIFIDDAPEQFVDVFLSNVLGSIEGSQLDTDNPGFVDSLRARVTDNVDRILVFKSCDIGQSFTSDGDCDGDPLEDAAGNPIEGGWQPYEVLEQADDGSFPNVFVDEVVTPGVTYLYSFVSVSKGFEPLILERDPLGNLIPVQFDGGAPVLRNPLSASSSDPNVVAVYVPASRQLGGQDARVVFTTEDEFLVSSFNPIEVTIAGDPDVGGVFSVEFGDSAQVVSEEGLDGGLSTTLTLYRVVTTSLDAGATTEDVVVDSSVFTTANPAGVDVAGGTTVVTTEQRVIAGDTVDVQVTTTTFSALTMAVIDEDGEPEFATSLLNVDPDTPGSHLGRPDFPQFLIDVAPEDEGEFISDDWLEPRADTLAVLQASGQPEVDWIEAQSVSSFPDLGEYLFEWVDHEYGPARVFVPNVTNPAATQEAVSASLNARSVGQTTTVSAEVAAALGEEEDSLSIVSLPFNVVNSTTGEQVIVAMTLELDSISIGVNENEVRVAVPEGVWVPGDRMAFLERRMLPRTAMSVGGEEYVVLDASGQPELVDSLVVTFERVRLGCQNRTICNPVPANAPGSDTGGHLPIDTDQLLRVRYASGIDANTAFSFQILPAVRGSQVASASAADLFEIKVVPNPYVFFSEYEQQRDSEVAKILFTNLPPEGRISIFTVSGQMVQRITYDSDQLAGNGDLFWDMRTMENTDLAAGLYLFLVEGTLPASGESVRKLGKFVVIR
ncbi:MAG TPA: hypothetical protein VK837_04320 [Longimicrobiales bacterium]|nr:hypothetical protein [Longimicrobiales bacterium]